MVLVSQAVNGSRPSSNFEVSSLTLRHGLKLPDFSRIDAMIAIRWSFRGACHHADYI